MRSLPSMCAKSISEDVCEVAVVVWIPVVGTAIRLALRGGRRGGGRISVVGIADGGDTNTKGGDGGNCFGSVGSVVVAIESVLD